MVGLGSSGVGIGLSVTLLDRFTANATRISNSMMAMTSTVNAQMASSLSAARRWGMGMAVVGALSLRAMGKAHSAFRKFDWELTTVAAIKHVTRNELVPLEKIVKTLAQESIFDPQEIAAASTRLAKSGWELTQIEKTMRAIVMLGTSTDTEIGGAGGVANMLSKIMKQFDIAPEGSMRAADVITKAVNSATMDMTDAFEALKFLGGTANFLGMGLEDSMAAIAVLANKGIPQGIAGRGMVNALFKMADVAGTMAKQGKVDALAKLGMTPRDLKDAHGNLLPIVDIIEKLTSATSTMGNVDAVSILGKLFRLRGARTIVPLITQNQTPGNLTFREMRQMLLDESGGEAQSVAKMRLESAEGVFRVMNDAWKTLKITWGAAIDGILTPLFKMLTKLFNGISKFVSTPLGKWFAIATFGAAALLTVAGLLTIALSSLGLLMTKGATTFSMMSKSMAWGWNSAAAAAMRYVTVVKMANAANMVGFNRINSGRAGMPIVTASGSRAVKGMKGFQSSGSAWVTSSGKMGPGVKAGTFSKATKVSPMMMGSAWTKSATRVGAASGSMLSGLGRLAGGFMRLLGPIAMGVSIIGMLVGWENMLKGVAYILGSVTNALRYLWDLLSGLIGGNMSFMHDAKINWMKNQYALSGVGYNEKPAKQKYKEYYQPTTTSEQMKAYGLTSKDVKEANTNAKKDPRYNTSKGTSINIENTIVVDNEIMQREMKRIADKQLMQFLQ